MQRGFLRKKQESCQQKESRVPDDNGRSNFITKLIMDDFGELSRGVVSLMGKELLEGIVATVDETAVRYRYLPIKSA